MGPTHPLRVFVYNCPIFSSGQVQQYVCLNNFFTKTALELVTWFPFFFIVRVVPPLEPPRWQIVKVVDNTYDMLKKSNLSQSFVPSQTSRYRETRNVSRSWFVSGWLLRSHSEKCSLAEILSPKKSFLG